jgi:SAM-dependent methyltransferase
MSELEAHRRNREQYAAVATNYAVSESHAAGEDLEWFTSRAGTVMPTVAVDVACGGGFSTAALAAAGHRVLAIDLTFEALAAARSATASATAGAMWTCAAAEHLPLATGAIALVGCRIAAHHFADAAQFVDEVSRALAPAGILLLVDSAVPEDDALGHWLNDVELLRDPSHQRSWPPSRWRAVLTGARLQVDETRSVRKRHELGPWLTRAGCVGDRAEAVLGRFRAAGHDVRSAYEIEYAAREPVAFTDIKLCVRASKPVV